MKKRKIPTKFGLIIKRDSHEAQKVAGRVISFLKKHHAPVFVPEERPTRLKGITKIPEYELRSQVDIVVVLGGDGTLLKTARLIGGSEIPLLGVHLGRLGFIMETTVDEVEERLKEILQGKFEVQRRVMLRGELHRNGKKVGSQRVLNDVVISKGTIARIFEVKVCVNGELVESLRGDGVIVSTPTGSTAYSLSAGGPVVHPETDSIVITPICSHMLTQRPLVVPHTSEIRLSLSDAAEGVYVSLDGQIAWEMKVDDEVVIKKSSKKISLIKSPVRSYYDMLKDKLKLGQR